MEQGAILAGRYRLEHRAGAGGMGEVWKAHDQETSEAVAVKLSPLRSAEDAARFAREAQILAGMSHPHVVRYVAHGASAEGTPYLVMEWLEGEDLAARLARGPLEVDESVALATAVADILGLAHERGVVHRDLKPSNLFLPGGRIDSVKVLDFGIARLGHATRMTRSGVLIGTPAYMAPEQARGEASIDARADVFSLGCVLFECLAGRPAFGGEHVAAILTKVLFDETPRLRNLRTGVPAALDDLLRRMLSKRREERPSGGQAAAAALRALGDAPPSPPVSSIPPPSLTSSEQRAVAVIVVSAAAGAEVRSFGGDTTLVQAPGDEAFLREAEAHGGRSERLVDGSVVVMLSGTETATDLCAQAARCALALRRCAAGRRVTLAMGRGERSARSMGPAIDRAARLSSTTARHAAPEGAVVLDEVASGLLDARFDVRECEGVFTLHGERPLAEGTRLLLGRATPCVGRERELGMLRALLTESIEEGTAQAALVVAPPGVGKSRLAQEFLREIREQDEGVSVWVVRGDALRAGSPLGMLGQALRSACRIQEGEPIEARRRKLSAEIAARVSPGHRRRVEEFLGEIVGAAFPDEDSLPLRAARRDAQRMADQVRAAFLDYLAAIVAGGPLVVVLEDLHWGDRPTVSLLDAALRDLADRPLFVLALARPEVRELFPRLWEGRRLHALRLNALSRRAGERLARHVLSARADAEAIARIVRLSEGNAFYLEELIRWTAEGRGPDVPGTVVAMVESRLGALDDEARRLLRAASVFGEVCWAGGVAALVGGEACRGQVTAGLEALVALEILVRRRESRFPAEDELAFRHALLREGAYAMLTEGDRELGHRLAGEWLERAGEPDPVVLAEHLQRGRAPDQAAFHYLRAGRQSCDRDDFGGALAHAQRGIDCGVQGEILGNLLALQGMAHCWRSEFDAGQTASAAALPLMGRGSQWACIALFHRAWASLVVGAEDDFVETVDRFVRFQPDAEAGREYMLWAPLAASLLQTYGRRALCRALLDRADALAAAMPTLDLDLRGALAIGRSDYVRAFERDPWRQLQLTRQAVEAFQAIEDLRDQITALNRLGQAEAELGDPAAGEATLRRAVALAQRIAIPFAQRQSALHLAALLSHGSDPSKWGEADEIARSLLDASGVSVGYRGWAHGICAEVLLQRGAYDGAVRHAREADALCDRIPLRRLWVTALLVRGLIRLGDPEEAARVASRIEPGLACLGGGGYVEIDARVALAEAHWTGGRVDEARAALGEAMRGIAARAEAIPDAAWRARYTTCVPEIVRARRLASAWA
ncbi:protein kinase [Sorangium sp. So ce1036]|uniref:protein kinase domain-containing protein n=1 Tax=Sorangium sp. So ce1036 TaxID=3133328 RepID=UPI003F0B2060